MWQTIIEALIPLLVGCDIYIVSTNGEYQQVNLASYQSTTFSSANHLAISLSDSSLAAYETKEPIEILESKFQDIPNTEVFVQINRTGPFYGYYLRVQKVLPSVQ